MGIQGWISNKLANREVNKLMKTVDQVLALDKEMAALSDGQLKSKTDEFKARLADGASLDDIMIEAFAVVREAAFRTVRLKAFPVQVLGAIVLHQGRVAEMKTGEGKTLLSALPAYLNALTGHGVHIITVNDYLAQRDRDNMGRVHQFLGLTVGCLTNDVRGEARKEQYQCDITYGTNNEFGFDYLRDNMVVSKTQMVQRELNYAIIDEVDSILVDEARTPLIISGSGRKSTDLYHKADQFVNTLDKDVDTSIDEEAKSIVLTDESGVVKAERYFNLENLSDPDNMEISHHINQALRARFMMKRDVDYVVKNGEILIVDEFTGRLMNGRRYSNGLHQAIESKEGLEVRKESQTLATITLQNYFRLYNKLSGMTGTAKTEEDELKHIYNMDVVVIPTNKPIIRDDMDDVIFRSIKAKFEAVVAEIKQRHAKGQPILVGTITIEVSELLSAMLKRQGIPHQVLNAKQHEREAEIVAQAGRFGAVTIATNMAGRGTDIVLGGNPDFMAKREMRKNGYSEELLLKVDSPLEFDDEVINEARATYQSLYEVYKEETDREADRVKAVGGLHIIGTERHESRRIDNQLRGRAGRQGDVGSTQFFISFEDDLMRLFLSERMKGMVESLGMEDDMQIEAGLLTRSIENAQKKVEGKNFSVRKHVLQYDDVMNRQREIIYNERRKVLEGEDIKDYIYTMVEETLEQIVLSHTSGSQYVDDWNQRALSEHLNYIFFADHYSVQFKEDDTVETLKARIMQDVNARYQELQEQIPADKLRDIERYILLKVVDDKWIDHIDAMDQLKQGIGLRAIGQQDPVKSYQIEGFEMFGEMINAIKEDTVRYLFHAQVTTDTQNQAAAVIESSHKQALQVKMASANAATANQVKKPFVRQEEKVGRNDPCPCGSGKKYKKCCGK